VKLIFRISIRTWFEGLREKKKTSHWCKQA